MIGWYVMKTGSDGELWLDADESTWTPRFTDAAEFTSVFGLAGG